MHVSTREIRFISPSRQLAFIEHVIQILAEQSPSLVRMKVIGFSAHFLQSEPILGIAIKSFEEGSHRSGVSETPDRGHTSAQSPSACPHWLRRTSQ